MHPAIHAASLSMCLVGVAGAQEQPAQEPPKLLSISELPPPLRLGVRAHAVRTRLPILPVVVVVADEASYIEAVARWTLAARYPVLIDDGSTGAREDIARFVRGFSARQVVRWSGAGAPAWPGADEARRELIMGAVARAWGAEPGADARAAMLARWAEVSLTPPGVVAASARDPAWTAALALSTGRGQPIAWVDAPRQVNATLSVAEAGELARAIEAECARTGFAWRELGDDLDAVTLCLGAPARTRLGEGGRESLATTDLIGRHGEGPGAGPRWAWCGQVFGTQSRAAYSAMCALFLDPRTAWLFDGYPGEGPWAEFDCSAAAAELTAAGFDVVVRDKPAQGERDWRQAAMAPVNAGLIFVNSKGRSDLFNLEPGQCVSGDVPFLRVPAIVHFVHSFSAVQPGQRRTIAGRWVERGAYAYFGSVDEPFLHSYVPTPMVARRLLAMAPWGAACRLDAGEAWKNAVFGDPLISVGEPPARTGEAVPLEGAIDVADELREHLGAKRFAEACATLTVLGRDDDAARLALTVQKDDPGAFTPALADAALMPLFRTGRRADVCRFYMLLDPAVAGDAARRDILWNAAWPDLEASSDLKVANLLRDHLREDQVARDGIDLAPMIERTNGSGAGQSFLSGLAATTSDPREKEELQRALTGEERRGRGRR